MRGEVLDEEGTVLAGDFPTATKQDVLQYVVPSDNKQRLSAVSAPVATVAIGGTVRAPDIGAAVAHKHSPSNTNPRIFYRQ